MSERRWYVWCPEHDAPRVSHLSPVSAEREAERLARAHRGSRFLVLETVGVALVPVEPPVFRRFDEGRGDDDLPF